VRWIVSGPSLWNIPFILINFPPPPTHSPVSTLTCWNDYVQNSHCELQSPLARQIIIIISYIVCFITIIIDCLHLLHTRRNTAELLVRKKRLFITGFGLVVHLGWFIAYSFLVWVPNLHQPQSLVVILCNSIATGISAAYVACILIRFIALTMEDTQLKVPGNRLFLGACIVAGFLALPLIAVILGATLSTHENTDLQDSLVRAFAVLVVLAAVLLAGSDILVCTGILKLLDSHLVVRNEVGDSGANTFARVRTQIGRLRFGGSFAITGAGSFAIIVLVMPSWLQYCLPGMVLSNCLITAVYQHVDGGIFAITNERRSLTSERTQEGTESKPYVINS